MSFASILTKFDDILYTWCLIYMLAGAGFTSRSARISFSSVS